MGRRVLLVALVGCLTAVGGLWAYRWKASSPVAPVTTARDVLALSPQAAENQLPVGLADAVVTSFDPEIRLIFVQDATAGVYLDSLAQPISVRVGDRVAVDGVTGRGARERVIAQARIRVTGRAELPAPLVLQPSQYWAGVGDSQWVEVEGILRALRPTMNRPTLEIVRNNVRAFVLVSDPGGEVPFSPGDHLRVRGVLGGGYNYKDRLIERRVFAPSLDYVTRDAAGTGAPALVPVDRLRAERGRAEYEGRVRVEGNVRAYVPGVALELASGDQQVRVALEIVLMDVQMPDMTGVETAERIRQREQAIAQGRASSAGASFQRAPQPHLPIVAMTAHVMESDRDACLAAGMDAFLSKPIAASELLDVMARLRPQLA